MHSNFKQMRAIASTKAEAQQVLINHDWWQTCINCELFDKKGELCTQFKVRPPATVIVNGCESWQFTIPF